jgi:hypothetical protein
MPDGRGFASDEGSDESQELGAFLEDWLEAILHSVRPRTWARYSEYVHLHLAPTLGSRSIGKLTPRELQPSTHGR